MKKLLLLAALAAISTSSLASQHVNGYYRSNGTYVQSYERSTPNQYRYDNYSSQGNTNPYTGQRGYERNEYSNPPAYNQGSGFGYQGYNNQNSNDN